MAESSRSYQAEPDPPASTNPPVKKRFAQPGSPPAGAGEGKGAVPEERRINVWVAERTRVRRRPLVLGETYGLRFQFAPPIAGSLVEGPATLIPEADIPELERMGVARIFTPGATTTEIVEWVRGAVVPV